MVFPSLDPLNPTETLLFHSEARPHVEIWGELRKINVPVTAI